MWLTMSTVATWQGLDRSAERIMKFDPEDFILVIVDEAHHGASPQCVCYGHRWLRLRRLRLIDSFTRVLHYFNSDVPLHGPVQPIEEWVDGLIADRANSQLAPRLQGPPARLQCHALASQRPVRHQRCLSDLRQRVQHSRPHQTRQVSQGAVPPTI